MRAAIRISVFLSCVVIALSCTPEGNRDSRSVDVRLLWLHQAQFAGFYAADQLGYYDNANLNVSLLPGGVDRPSTIQVASGSTHFGVTGAAQLLKAREQGHDLVAISVIYRQTPFTLFSRASSDISDMQDLTHATVGVKYGDITEVVYRAMLHAAGVDSSNVQETSVRYDMTPFFRGEVDVWPGYRINEPLIAESRGYPVQLITPEAYGVRMYSDVLFARADFLEQHPKLAGCFASLTMEGWQYALENPKRAAAFVTSYADNADTEHQYDMLTSSIPLINNDSTALGVMHLAQWRQLNTTLHEVGYLDAPINVHNAFTNQHLLTTTQSDDCKS